MINQNHKKYERKIVHIYNSSLIYSVLNLLFYIYPGFILTEMTEGILSQPTLVEKFASESPLHLLGEPKDIGYCALYLASDAARFVTGQDFVIDGGAAC